MILGYLCRVLKYYATKTVVRVIKSTVTAKADLAKEVEQIDRAESKLSYQMQLFEVEQASNTMHAIEKWHVSTERGHEEANAALERLQQTLGSLSAPISRMDTRLADIHDNLHADARTKVLKAISSMPYSTHHRVAREGRLPNSGQWLLQNEVYREWRGSSSSSVLWLHGIPGCGKTKLTSLVVDDVRPGGYLAFFYCTRNPAEPLRSQCRAVLASIVRQLATAGGSKGVFSSVVEQSQDAIDGFADSDDQSWTIAQCQRVIIDLLKEYPAVTVVIDALDEVLDEERQDLMNSLAQIIEKTMEHGETLLKIFISSRDNLDITSFLKGSPNVYIGADENHQDVRAFT